MSTIHAIDWGDVPTWLGAVTTTLALIAAAAVIRIEMRRDKREVQRLERADQADSVAAWFDDESTQLLLRNGSGLPIYNVRISIVSDAPQIAVIPVSGVVPPGDTRMDFPAEVLGAYAEMSIKVQFTDTAGRSWQRSIDGTLKRLPDVYARTMFVEMESRTLVVPPQGDDESSL